MTDNEYNVLDELYFVVSFEELQKKLQIHENELRDTLRGLYEKGWIKCFEKMPEEFLAEEPDFQVSFKNYHYLATKAGLLIHNSK